MNFMKGFRFHPTDEEFIEYLNIKTFDRDSLVKLLLQFKTYVSRSLGNYLKTFKLKKKKADISSNEAGQSDQHSLSNLENYVANNATSEDFLNPNGSSEPEASNNDDNVHNCCSTVEIFGGGRSNQHNMVNEDEGSNVSSNFINHVAEDAIPKVHLHLKEVSSDRNGHKDNGRVQNPYSNIEQDDESCNSILTNYDETVKKREAINII